VPRLILEDVEPGMMSRRGDGGDSGMASRKDGR
jgi:hypothetical protein